MANYIDSLLASGEHIVRRSHQHWFVFIANARYAVLALVIAFAASVFGIAASISGTLWTILSWAVLALFVFGLASVAWTVVRYRSEEYLITNRRLMHSQGVINKKTTDSSLEKINDAILTESIFGRMFGFGDLDVLTASEEGIEKLRMLRDAKSFKKAMIEAKHELELELTRPTMPPLRDAAQRPPRPPPPPCRRLSRLLRPPSHRFSRPRPLPQPAPRRRRSRPARSAVSAPEPSMSSEELADSLSRLGELRDQGLITSEEFDAKKAELLDRL